MLKGSALSLYTRKCKVCTIFEDSIALLGEWINSKDKQSRLRGEWHAMSLSRDMEGCPNESEISVFRAFISRVMSLQHQLHDEYHSDIQLRDRLLTAVDIPTIRDTLRDKRPRTSHQLIHLVPNRLSTNKKTAGTISAHLATRQQVFEEDSLCDIMYSLGQFYGGNVKRNIKSY